jgi:hypothetical protein
MPNAKVPKTRLITADTQTVDFVVDWSAEEEFSISSENDRLNIRRAKIDDI